MLQNVLQQDILQQWFLILDGLDKIEKDKPRVPIELN
jgi:hypothetical protein